jgi:hypothetical protein
VVIGVVAVIVWGVSDESNSLNATGDPGGVILRAVVRSVSEHVPVGSQLLSHQYEEPRWRNCGIDRPAAYSDVQAHFVYRIPPVSGATTRSGSGQHRWVLTPGWLTPFTWSQQVTLALRDATRVSDTISVTAQSTSGASDIWMIDASAYAFGRATGFCGGPVS